MAKDIGIQLIDDNSDGELLDIVVDVVRNAEGKIIQGMRVGNTLQQNKALLLITQLGEIKNRPDVGVGIQDLLLSEDYLELRGRIREHFAKDGLIVRQLDLYQNKPVIIDADYNS